MDHVVFTDTKSKELEKIIEGQKTMIIRGATGRKLPYGRVNVGDVLYFINNKGEGEVRAKATAKSVFNSEKMEIQESIKLVDDNQTKLNLEEKQYQKWAGKRYIVLIEIEKVEEIMPIKIDKSSFGNMDDWLPVDKIEKVMV